MSTYIKIKPVEIIKKKKKEGKKKRKNQNKNNFRKINSCRRNK